MKVLGNLFCCFRGTDKTQSASSSTASSSRSSSEFDPANPVSLGTEVHGPADIDKRPIVHLKMGQGVVADLSQVKLVSDDFSSCSPLVLFNARTAIGALFHVPAGELTDPALSGQVKECLKGMYERVQPTEIHVNYRGRNGGIIDEMKMVTTPRDDEEQENGIGWKPDSKMIDAFFKQECGFEGECKEINPPDAKGKAFQYCTVTLADDVVSGDNTVSISRTMNVTRVTPVLVAPDSTPEQAERVIERCAHLPRMEKFGWCRAANLSPRT